MRAARLYGKEDLRVESVPDPVIGEGDILLKIKAAAICGTDIRMYRNGAKNATPETPLILGHEIAGIIEKVGPGVSGYREGMRVAVAPNMGCGVCDECVSGNTQLCSTYRAFGINIPGAFAELMRIPTEAVRQGNIAPIPDGVDFASAAMVEPLSCVYNAFRRIAIAPGDTVLVIGAGPIGLMHAKLALMAGAAKVFMNDLSAERMALCTEREPGILALPADGLAERILEETKGRGLSVCITAAPSAEAQIMALELAGLNARVMFFGGLPAGKSKVPLDTNLVHYKQLTITGITRSSISQYRACLGLIAARRLVVEDLATRRSGLDGIHDSFAQIMQGRGLKAVVEMS
ncbi:MAG TPA: alcohol dehydrogenase catalytic domain-containing protein [Spirochaetia bacterium]